MSNEKYEIDKLDREIILELQEDARRQFKIIAGKLKVSEGTIKNRVERLIKQDILKLEARVNPFALSRRISAIVGLNLKERNHEDKIKEIEKIPCVTSVWNATGRFDLFFEVMVDSLESLNDVLFKEDLKEIGGISYTETFVILSSNSKFFTRAFSSISIASSIRPLLCKIIPIILWLSKYCKSPLSFKKFPWMSQ